jgi:hypothetical protein
VIICKTDFEIWDRLLHRPALIGMRLETASFHADCHDYHIMRLCGLLPREFPGHAISYFPIRRRQAILAGLSEISELRITDI